MEHILVGGFVGLWLMALAVGILTSIFWIVELIDAVRRDYPDPNMKWIWAAVIFFSHIIGALVYYFVGKPMGTIPGETPRPRF